MISRSLIDKSHWPTGTWSTEPDAAVWLETPLILPCLVARMGMGALNGYVGVPTGHKLHGRGEDATVLAAHGGINFAGKFPATFATPALFAELADQPPAPIADYWWIGFDTAHAGDLLPNFPMALARSVYRDFNYVVDEVKRLADQVYRTHHPLEYLAQQAE